MIMINDESWLQRVNHAMDFGKKQKKKYIIGHFGSNYLFLYKMHSLCLLYFIHHLNASPDIEVHTIPGIRLLSNRFSFSAGDFNFFTYQEAFCLAIAADRK